MNEEEVKIKIVLPFLKDLGFIKDDLVFEESFSIKAGRNTFIVDNSKIADNINPRLDILVKDKIRQKNLFVLEIKSDQTQIQSEDIDQAISYSRLVHPIAPFSLITNGKEIKIFDTISKKEIIDNFNTVKLKSENSEIKLDIEIYYEAVANFLSYSENNLRNFIRKEYQLNTKNVRGSIEEKNKIYIDDVYVPSEKLNRVFDYFTTQEKKVFGLVGLSGMGKTCWMCNTAERLIEKNIPLFYYNFKEIKNGIFSDIANDLNWSEDISPVLNEYEAINRIMKIFSKSSVYIFLDGLDERHQGNDLAIIEEFVKQIHNRNIKLVVTCKTYEWEKFIKSDRTVTKFSDELFSGNENNDNKNEENKYNGIVLSELENNQLNLIINKYRKFYGYQGKIQTSLNHEFKRNPFLLRIAFEYASKEEIQFLNYSIKELYEFYIDQLLSPITNETIRKVFLIEITKLFSKFNNPSIPIEKVINITNFDSELLEQYLRWNILSKRVIKDVEIVEFYFSRLRDYLIAYKIARFDSYNQEQFESFLKTTPTDVNLEAFNFYYSLTNNSQKRLIDSNIYKKAKYFLEEREKIISQFFDELKSIFNPYTKRKVGIYLDVDLVNGKIISYGFRSVEDDADKILINPSIKGSDIRNIFFDYSITQLSMTEDLPNRPAVIKKMLFKELQDNIKANKYKDIPFNFKNNKYVLIERILEYVEKYYHQELQLDRKKSIYDVLPVDLSNLQNLIYHAHIIDILSYNSTFDDSEYEWKPKTYGYYYDLNDEAIISIKKEATKIINNEVLLKQYLSKYPLSIVDEILIDDIENLFKYDVTSIDDTLIPAQISKNDFSFENVDSVTTKNTIQRITKIFLDEYQNFVEINFPALYKLFPFASNLPVKVNIYSDPDEHEPHYATILMFKDMIKNNTVECIDWKQSNFPSKDYDELYAQMKSQFNVVSCVMHYSMKGFYDRNNPDRYTISGKKQRWDVNILRRFIFDLLDNDIENYLKNEEYKLLSNVNIRSSVSPNTLALFMKYCEIALQRNSIRISSEELKTISSEKKSVIIEYLLELEEKSFITNLSYTINKKTFWFELNYFALYQYCKGFVANFDEIEKSIWKFLVQDKKEIEKFNSQQLADHLGIEHQILRSILFELEKQKVIKLQNVLSGISWILK